MEKHVTTKNSKWSGKKWQNYIKQFIDEFTLCGLYLNKLLLKDIDRQKLKKNTEWFT